MKSSMGEKTLENVAVALLTIILGVLMFGLKIIEIVESRIDD